MSWSSFQDKTTTPDNFNSPLGGSMIKPGEHTVAIESVETKETRQGQPYLQVSWTDGDATLRDGVFIFERESQDLGYRYLLVLNALFGDVNVAHEFNEAVRKDLGLFQALAGLKLDVVVEEGSREGDWTVKNGSEGFQIVDAGTGEYFGEIGDRAFEDYKDLRDYMKENHGKDSANPIYRAYPRIAKFRKNEGEVDKNVRAIQSAFAGGVQTGTGQGTTAGAKPRTAI